MAPERDIPVPSVPAEIESQSLHQEWHKAIEYGEGKPCNLTPKTLYDTITLLYDIGQNWKSKYEKAHEAIDILDKIAKEALQNCIDLRQLLNRADSTRTQEKPSK